MSPDFDFACTSHSCPYTGRWRLKKLIARRMIASYKQQVNQPAGDKASIKANQPKQQ